MNENLKALASKYERKEFLVGDPSWFMHQIEGDTNRELLAFIASSLSYGSRKQFLPKIQLLLDDINSFAAHDDIPFDGHDNNSFAAHNVISFAGHDNISFADNGNSSFADNDDVVAKWLMSHAYSSVVGQDDGCFYRLYTNRTYNDFLFALSELVRQYGSIKQYLINNMKGNTCLEAIELITQWFREHGSIGVIPKNAQSSCKRVCMFLRWMARDNSPVDLGIWSDIIDKRTLIIPMDTHVIQEARKLGLLTSKTVSMASAIKLSNRLAESFPDDPIKGDFALFGLGVDEENKTAQI